MAESRVYRNTDRTKMSETKETFHLNILEDCKKSENQPTNNEAIKEHNFMTTDKDVNQRRPAARKERPRQTKSCTCCTIKIVVILIFAMMVLRFCFAGMAIAYVRAEIGKLQDLQLSKQLSNIDESMSTMWRNLARMDEHIDNLEHELYITLEALALIQFSFEPATLHKNVYMSSDNQKISTQIIPGGRKGSGNGFQNYEGVLGAVHFTEFDVAYFEVSVTYEIVNSLSDPLLFEIGFSTADTIDGSHFLNGQNKYWSLVCRTNVFTNMIVLQEQHSDNGYHVKTLETLTTSSPNVTYNCLYGFYADGPKGEVYVIDKNSSETLYKFENVDFSENLYPVFAVFGSSRVNTTLTLNTVH